MMVIKKYECKICKDFVKNGVKGQSRLISSRSVVRKHLVDVHRIKGRKNRSGLKKDDFGESFITKNTIAEDFI